MPPRGGTTLQEGVFGGMFWNILESTGPFSFLTSLLVTQDFEVFLIQHGAVLYVFYISRLQRRKQ